MLNNNNSHIRRLTLVTWSSEPRFDLKYGHVTQEYYFDQVESRDL